MSREIWQEGRVVGYSAYESFVKQYLDTDPNGTPPSEKQWLAASIGCGSAMLLKLPGIAPEPPYNYSTVDIPLPEGSRLCAGNTIYASFFYGKAQFDDDSPWAKCVSEYGFPINNIDVDHPNAGEITQSEISTSTVPTEYHGTDITTHLSSHIAVPLAEYCKILDGIIIQPGTWERSNWEIEPAMDFKPNYAEPPVLRLLIYGQLFGPVYILLTGFTPRGVMLGVAGSDGSTDTPAPEDGDFLGPAIYPWANKVVFTLPAGYGTLVQPKYNLYDLSYNSSQGATVAKGVSVTTLVAGSKTNKMISLVDGSYNDYNLNGTGGKINATGAGTAADNKHRGELTWANLMEAVANNKSIDLAYDIIKSTGTGITVTRDTTGNTIGRYVISTNLTGGTGISVSGATINANIVAGDGITISHSDHTYTIKNAALDTSNYVKLQYAGDNPPPTPPGADPPPLIDNNQYKTFGINGFTSGVEGESWTTHPHPELDMRIKKETSGLLPRWRIKISGAVGNLRLRSMNLGQHDTTAADDFFRFYHSSGTVEAYMQGLVLIVGFQFIDPDIAAPADFYFEQPDGVYALEDVTGGFTGFWNMKYRSPATGTPTSSGAYGGSWNAVCRAFLLDTATASSSSTAPLGDQVMYALMNSTPPKVHVPSIGKHCCYIVVRADSYVDGYNDQLYNSGWAKALNSSYPNGWALYSDNIHMDIECVLKKVQ